jgi:hypothetical protein
MTKNFTTEDTETNTEDTVLPNKENSGLRSFLRDLRGGAFEILVAR